MRPADIKRNPDGRPEFMALLGLAPPYSPEDVRHAYLAKAKALHPDHGGNAQEFNALHAAFTQAQQYLEIKTDSRRWIANQMQNYLSTRTLAEQLRGLGAVVEVDGIDWLKRSFGDFADLTDSVTSVVLDGAEPATADTLLNTMTASPDALARLSVLRMPNCGLKDLAIEKISVFKRLEHVSLAGNAIGGQAASSLVRRLPQLVKLDLEGLPIGWWAARRIRKQLSKRMEERLTLPL